MTWQLNFCLVPVPEASPQADPVPEKSSVAPRLWAPPRSSASATAEPCNGAAVAWSNPHDFKCCLTCSINQNVLIHDCNFCWKRMIFFRGFGGFILMYICGCGALNNDQKYKPGESHFVLKSPRRRERHKEREREILSLKKKRLSVEYGAH